MTYSKGIDPADFAMHAAASQTSRHNSLYALVLHPIVLLALMVWLLNDHVLKHCCASWWTGKLSDVCALIAGPVVLGGLWCLVARRPQHIRAAVTIAAATLALVMTLINTCPVAADVYRWGLGTAQWPFRWLWAWALGESRSTLVPVYLIMDPSDLLALPAALVAPWLLRGS